MCCPCPRQLFLSRRPIECKQTFYVKDHVILDSLARRFHRVLKISLPGIATEGVVLLSKRVTTGQGRLGAPRERGCCQNDTSRQ